MDRGRKNRNRVKRLAARAFQARIVKLLVENKAELDVLNDKVPTSNTRSYEI